MREIDNYPAKPTPDDWKSNRRQRIYNACQHGLATWRTAHPRWWKQIDGTPIPNDLLVHIVDAVANELEK